MSIPASTLRKIASLGLSSEQMAGVLDVLADLAAADEERRAGQRERTRRHRAQRDGNVTVTSQERYNLSPKEKSPTPPKEITPIPEPIGSDVGVKRARATDLAGFKAECAGLDAERIEALVKHRRAKNAQLTAHAARLFRRDAEACGLSLAEAVDTCISRNWITVKPEYLRDRQRTSSPATAPPHQMDRVNAILNDLQGKPNVPQHSGPTFDGSLERTDRRGVASVVQFDAISARGRS